LDSQTKERIRQMIDQHSVFLFMKGTPTFPQCGFSNQVVQILKAYDVPFGSANILEDPELRQGIKEYSDWPTIPQLYIKSEFIGGCDIVREAWESGELTEQLRSVFPDREITPPARPVNITPQQARDMLAQKEGRFLDVRSPEEREIAMVEGFDLLDQDTARDIIESGDKDRHLVFICHFGGRSAQAADYFSGQGFRKVFNVTGGIDAWSQTIDDSIPRY